MDMKKGLVIGIIALFIAISVTPLAIGYNQDTILLKGEQYNYDSYHLSEIKENRIIETTQQTFKSTSSNKQQGNNILKTLNPTLPATLGLMNSSWPMKCHDTRHTSRSPYSTEGNNGFEKWRFECGEIESSPIIGDDGTIYFGTMGSDHKLYALYPDGTEKWHYTVGGLIWATPAIAEDGTVYVVSYDSYLHAVNPDGSLKWKFGSGNSISSSPVIGDDGTIYFGTMWGSGTGGKIFAVNPDGTEKWRYQTGYHIVSDPVMGDDGTIYIGSSDHYFYAMNPNGSLKWRFETEGDVKGHPSIGDDGTIFFPSDDGFLYALYPDGSLKWKTDTEWGARSSAAIGEDGTLYIGTEGLRAIYPNNGTVKWILNIGKIGFPSPAISADGTIYVCNSDDKCIVAVHPDGFELWHKYICTEHAQSSPAIGEDGTIYVGCTCEDENHMWYGILYALGWGDLEVNARGPYYGLVGDPVHFSCYALGGNPPYSYLWDFGDGNSSDEQNPLYSYSNPDSYTVTLTVTDYDGNTSSDVTFAWIQETNDPPEIPNIDGPTNGQAGTSYSYNFETTDVDGNDIWYFIYWGYDDYLGPVNTGWLGPYSSGEDITLDHVWDDEGTYVIECKAKDVYGEESEWGTLEVTMPVDQQTSVYGFPIIQRILEMFPNAFPILRQILNLIY